MDERKVKDIPKDERSQLIGQLDANTTFKEFFNKTDEFFPERMARTKALQAIQGGEV